MNFTNVIFQEHANPYSFLAQLPTLGPLQMVCAYTNGGKAIKEVPQLTHALGTRGQFKDSLSIALDREANVAIYDTRQHQIHLFGPNGAQLPSMSIKGRTFELTAGFIVGPDNNFYFTDSSGISVHDRLGNRCKEEIRPSDGTEWVTPKIALTDDGHYLLTNNTFDGQLQFFDSAGCLLTKRNLHNVSMFGGPEKQHFPWNVAWDPSTNTFAVAEICPSEFSYSSRLGIYKYNQGTNTIDFIHRIPLSITEGNLPISAVSFDRTGNLVVAQEEGEVHIFPPYTPERQTIPSPDGRVFTYISEPRGGAKKQTLRCQGASSVAVDADGRVYVLERRAYRLSVWQ